MSEPNLKAVPKPRGVDDAARRAYVEGYIKRLQSGSDKDLSPVETALAVEWRKGQKELHELMEAAKATQQQIESFQQRMQSLFERQTLMAGKLDGILEAAAVLANVS